MAWRWAAATLTCIALGCDTDPRTEVPCEGPVDCNEAACIAANSEKTADLEPLPLECGATGSGSSVGELCERGADCRTGICALAGTCVAACEHSDDCSARERCQLVYARGSRARLHPVEACVAMIDLPADTQIRVETLDDAFNGGVSEIALPPTATTTLFVIEHLDDASWPVPAADTNCRPPLCADRLVSNDTPEEAAKQAKRLEIRKRQEKVFKLASEACDLYSAHPKLKSAQEAAAAGLALARQVGTTFPEELREAPPSAPSE